MLKTCYNGGGFFNMYTKNSSIFFLSVLKWGNTFIECRLVILPNVKSCDIEDIVVIL